jgi:hypothetical protein
MTSPGAGQPQCRVIGAEKLSGQAVSAADVCGAITRAVGTRAGRPAFRVDVRVVSPSRLAATILLADGRRLPDLNMASMDRNLSKASVERFAKTIAAEITKNVH